MSSSLYKQMLKYLLNVSLLIEDFLINNSCDTKEVVTSSKAEERSVINVFIPSTVGSGLASDRAMCGSEPISGFLYSGLPYKNLSNSSKA